MIELGQGPADTDLIKDVSDQSFMVDVIEASADLPVIVDFWAPWCGPCKTLGPAIEAAVTAAGGRVKLVKIDVDANPGYAGQLRVQSIPTVFAFHQGQPVDGFQGALPPSEIQAFVDKIAAMGPEADNGLADAIEAAEQMLADGEAADAAETFAAILQEDPANAAAYAGLVRSYLAIGDVDQAEAVLNGAPAEISTDPLLEAAHAQVTLAREAENAGPVADLTAAVDQLAGRITVLENQPRVVGEGSAPATAAYQAELDALRIQIADMTNIAQTQLETARAEAAAIEENAATAARNAAGRAALSRVQSALETGAPLGAALGDLEAALGQSAPAALLAAQDGVPTMQNLRESYADVARAALSTARSEGVSGEETGGFGAFLRDQLDVRSTAPRDGADADAVLSRAGAAIDSGRLPEALAEIAGLPEVARAEMSDWLARAEIRVAAQAAVDLLSTSLSDN